MFIKFTKSETFPLTDPLVRARALFDALGVIGELDTKHDLTGYTVSVCQHEEAPLVRVWGSPEVMAAIFSKPAHAGPWYGGDRPQRNLTRIIRGVHVSTIQNKADALSLDVDGREVEPRAFRTVVKAEWEAGYSAREAGEPLDTAGTLSWAEGWDAARQHEGAADEAANGRDMAATS